MSPSIFITGATGNVGQAVVSHLQQKNINCVVGVRDPLRIKTNWGKTVQVRAFNFLESSTFQSAFAGIKSLFLVRPPQLANIDRQLAPAIHAAINAGVEHIVFLSLQGVEQATMTPHYKIEQLIRSLDIEYTFLRAGFFMQNLSTTHLEEIRDEQKIAVPVGKAKTSFIDVRDIGEVGAIALTDTVHRNQSHTLTGAEALTYYQVADILSAVLGKPINYTNPNPIQFFIRTAQKSKSLSYALVVTALYTATRAGSANSVSDDVITITGHSPSTFQQFAEDHREQWLST